MGTVEQIRLSERIGVSLLTLTPITFIVFLIVAHYPEWWKWIIYESTPMTWLQSILLYTIALIGAGCAHISLLTNENQNAIRWVLLSLGFLFLSLDERFAVHERIRDHFLAPINIKLPWTMAGDVMLLLVLMAVIILLPQFLELFKGRKLIFYLFIAGILTSAVAVVIDSFDVSHLSIEFQRLEQFLEELIESMGMLFLVNAFFLRLTLYIRNTVIK